MFSFYRPFRSSAMVSRIAEMLNYFLVKLVDRKKMGALKVWWKIYIKIDSLGSQEDLNDGYFVNSS